MSVSTGGQGLPVDLLFIAANGTVMEVHYCIPTDFVMPITSTSSGCGAPVGLWFSNPLQNPGGDQVTGGGISGQR